MQGIKLLAVFITQKHPFTHPIIQPISVPAINLRPYPVVFRSTDTWWGWLVLSLAESQIRNTSPWPSMLQFHASNSAPFFFYFNRYIEECLNNEGFIRCLIFIMTSKLTRDVMDMIEFSILMALIWGRYHHPIFHTILHLASVCA
jgi:hypothetical protein